MGQDTTRLIALDWGTTRLRAYRLDGRGRVLERRDREAGILKVPSGDFARALQDVAGDWLAAWPETALIACGMIGSRQGWREVPYVPCPAGLPELAAALGRVDLPDGDRVLWLAPGLVSAEGGMPDVMRGEETQIVGALAGDPSRRCFVLPGTHSKWAWAEGGRIERFSTYMTGELFEVLSHHSILGRLMTGREPESEGFARGLDRARAGRDGPPGRLLHELFSARTLPLVGELASESVAGYLSGLLIGMEVVAALAEAPAASVTIVAEGALASLYAQALAVAEVPTAPGNGAAAAVGLLAIAREAGLLGGPNDA